MEVVVHDGIGVDVDVEVGGELFGASVYPGFAVGEVVAVMLAAEEAFAHTAGGNVVVHGVFGVDESGSWRGHGARMRVLGFGVCGLGRDGGCARVPGLWGRRPTRVGRWACVSGSGERGVMSYACRTLNVCVVFGEKADYDQRVLVCLLARWANGSSSSLGVRP